MNAPASPVSVSPDAAAAAAPGLLAWDLLACKVSFGTEASLLHGAAAPAGAEITAW